MSARIREKSVAIPGGTATWYNGLLDPNPSSSSYDSHCNDIVGNYQGTNPLYLEHTSPYWWACYGIMRDNGYGWHYNGYVRNGFVIGHEPATSSPPSDNETLSEALARTNPNRSEIDLPIFLFELRDIPRLLEFFAKIGAGIFKKRPIKTLGEAYLTYEFGVAPFMRDLADMMNFVNLTERRLRELRNLQNAEKGLGRKWTVWRDESKAGPHYNIATPLYQESNWTRCFTMTRRRKWASTRWIPTTDISSFSDDELRKRANRAVFGLDISFATLWEAMPWSWLIDWFSNVGDIVSQTRNTIPVKHDGSCVMQETATYIIDVMHDSGPGSNCTYKPLPIPNRVTKTRSPMVFGPLPEFNLPFLNGKQLSILASLLVTRM